MNTEKLSPGQARLRYPQRGGPILGHAKGRWAVARLEATGETVRFPTCSTMLTFPVSIGELCSQGSHL